VRTVEKRPSQPGEGALLSVGGTGGQVVWALVPKYIQGGREQCLVTRPNRVIMRFKTMELAGLEPRPTRCDAGRRESALKPDLGSLEPYPAPSRDPVPDRDVCGYRRMSGDLGTGNDLVPNAHRDGWRTLRGAHLKRFWPPANGRAAARGGVSGDGIAVASGRSAPVGASRQRVERSLELSVGQWIAAHELANRPCEVLLIRRGVLHAAPLIEWAALSIPLNPRR
jgi:hypothetical protein